MSDSPCTGVCTIDPKSGLCKGCYRTQEEIAKWSMYREYQKKKVLSGLKNKRIKL